MAIITKPPTTEELISPTSPSSGLIAPPPPSGSMPVAPPSSSVASISAENQEIIDALADYLNPDGTYDLTRALQEGVDYSVLVQAFTASVVDNAKDLLADYESVIAALEDYKNDDGTYRIVEAIDAGVPRETLVKAFGEESVASAEQAIATYNAMMDDLSKYLDPETGNYFLDKAILDGIVSEETLIAAFGPDAVAQMHTFLDAHVAVGVDDWVAIEEWNKLTPEQQQKLKELGINDYNLWVEQENARIQAEQAEFERNHIYLEVSDEWVPTEKWDELTPYMQQKLTQLGVTEFNNYFNNAAHRQSNILGLAGFGVMITKAEQDWYNLNFKHWSSVSEFCNQIMLVHTDTGDHFWISRILMEKYGTVTSPRWTLLKEVGLAEFVKRDPAVGQMIQQSAFRLIPQDITADQVKLAIAYGELAPHMTADGKSISMPANPYVAGYILSALEVIQSVQASVGEVDPTLAGNIASIQEIQNILSILESHRIGTTPEGNINYDFIGALASRDITEAQLATIGVTSEDASLYNTISGYYNPSTHSVNLAVAISDEAITQADIARLFPNLTSEQVSQIMTTAAVLNLLPSELVNGVRQYDIVTPLLEGNITEAQLIQAGFSEDSVQIAIKAVEVLNALSDYKKPDGYDIATAIKDNVVTVADLEAAGFPPDSIAAAIQINKGYLKAKERYDQLVQEYIAELGAYNAAIEAYNKRTGSHVPLVKAGTALAAAAGIAVGTPIPVVDETILALAAAGVFTVAGVAWIYDYLGRQSFVPEKVADFLWGGHIKVPNMEDFVKTPEPTAPEFTVTSEAIVSISQIDVGKAMAIPGYSITGAAHIENILHQPIVTNLPTMDLPGFSVAHHVPEVMSIPGTTITEGPWITDIVTHPVPHALPTFDGMLHAATISEAPSSQATGIASPGTLEHLWQTPSVISDPITRHDFDSFRQFYTGAVGGLAAGSLESLEAQRSQDEWEEAGGADISNSAVQEMINKRAIIHQALTTYVASLTPSHQPGDADINQYLQAFLTYLAATLPEDATQAEVEQEWSTAGQAIAVLAYTSAVMHELPASFTDTLSQAQLEALSQSVSQSFVNAQATTTSPVVLTETNIQPIVETITQAAPTTQTDLQALVNTLTQAITATTTATSTATSSASLAASRAATRARTSTASLTGRFVPSTFPGGSDGDTERPSPDKLLKGAVAWKQGFMYRIKLADGTEYYTREPIPGVKQVFGPGSAQASAVAIGDEWEDGTKIDSMGITEVTITHHGNKRQPRLQFHRVGHHTESAPQLSTFCRSRRPTHHQLSTFRQS